MGPKGTFGRARRALVVVAVVTATFSGGASPGGAAEREDEKRSFIVLLDDSVADPRAVAAEHARRYGAEITYVYEHAVKGYAGTFTGSGASDAARDQRVRRVEPDGEATMTTTQTAAPWGLDRIDQHVLPLSTSFTYTETGAGVTAYVIDTGIRTTHRDFGGRASLGPNYAGGTNQDCQGHGTHVAGTIGGTTYGVAKGVSLVSVRVLGCTGTGTTSGVIAGVDWVTGNHQAGRPAVANMSLTSGASASLDEAVRRSVADGVSYALAAGNGNIVGIAQNACHVSPARVAEAMTVGATDRTDKKAYFSNYGTCVDWFAPGVDIVSDSNSSDTATTTKSGTSMATPHTAGVAALYLQAFPTALPSVVRDALFTLTTKGVVTSARTTNNHLLFTNL